MPVLVLKSAVFDTLEGVLATQAPTLDNQEEFDIITQGWIDDAPKILQLSSTLIRVSQDVLVWDGTHTVSHTYELRLSGSGIGPVSTIKALMTAINDGMAKGTLTKMEIMTEGHAVLGLTMDRAGYHLTSGDIRVDLTGTLPLTFAQFFDIAGLFDQVAHIEDLTRGQRATLFADLSAYSVSGLTLTEAGHVLFAVNVTATTASLTLGGLTLTANGRFPSNLGEDVQALWDLFRAVSSKTLAADNLTSFAGLSVTSLQIRDAAGHLLGNMADPMADTPLVYRVDGVLYNTVETGDNGDNHLDGYVFDRLVLAGLAGRDEVQGGLKADYLIGGTGNDTVLGAGGTDRLDGGTGRDVLAGGADADVFRFDLGDGIDRITDFAARVDVIQILDATRKSDLTFTQMGEDVLLDYRSIHILIDHITVAQLDQVVNFQF